MVSGDSGISDSLISPRKTVLDLFCGAGGAAKGYHRAGFRVVGVDIAPQKNYPFKFIQADAISYLYNLIFTGEVNNYDLIHASPPCQAYSDLQKRSGFSYPDLIPITRRLLVRSTRPYVIENVDTAPLVNPDLLCGAMFEGLRVYRHRLFECAGFEVEAPPHPKHTALVYTKDKRKNHYGRPLTDDMFVQVTGGGNAPQAEKLKAMGIDWRMNRKEVNEAIPPAYTEWIGKCFSTSFS